MVPAAAATFEDLQPTNRRTVRTDSFQICEATERDGEEEEEEGRRNPLHSERVHHLSRNIKGDEVEREGEAVVEMHEEDLAVGEEKRPSFEV